MHREKIIQKLEKYFPENSHEKKCRLKILEFVKNNTECFERSFGEGHITGSAWLLNSKSDSVFLTHHKKLNKWLQPGGHSDGNADTLMVALREAYEESGLKNIIVLNEEIFDVDIHQIPEIKNEKEHWHYDIRFLLQAKDDDSLLKSDESHEIGWFDYHQLLKMNLEESVMRMAKKWKNDSHSR